MSGYFELVDAPDGGYRIRMLDGTGKLMAISVTFPTKRAAVAGVSRAREIAGTGLIRDRSHEARGSRNGKVSHGPVGHGINHGAAGHGTQAAAGS